MDESEICQYQHCQEAALRNKAMAANWLYITEGFNDNKHFMLNITHGQSPLTPIPEIRSR